MNFRNLVAAVATLTLTAVPAMAQAVDRAAAPVAEASQMGGSSTLLLLIAVVLMGAGIYFLVDNNNNNPNSP